ncbi:MAG TPA: carboxypeptidase-like regulatory domain-containing protein [Candidatus Binatia bacterium]|nr:carboxypeptidase-like regulatory domain-containing protein [Candidatus Binatia bacterium]
MKNLGSLRVLTFLLSLFCVSPYSARSQEIAGTISGVVSDPSGRVVAGASITIFDTDRSIVRRTLKTSGDGHYSAPLLPIGRYRVIAEAPGFKTAGQSAIHLSVSDKLEVNLVFQVAGAKEEVRVTASDLQPASAGVIGGTQIRELPLNTRNLTTLVSLQPGVSDNLGSDQSCIGTVGALGSSGTGPIGSTNGIGYAVNGQRASENNWTLDGADNLDRGQNLSLLTYPGVDSIEEFRLQRSNYAPEFPSGSSSQVVAVTRAGTSRFHGSVYEFFKNDVLAANNFFNNRYGLIRPPLRYNNFGFTIGGPLHISGVYNPAKNKTFFFYSDEWRRVIDYSTFYTGTLPTLAMLQGTFNNPVCTQPIFDPNTGACTGPTTTQITNFDSTAAAYIKDIYSKLPPRSPNGNLVTTATNQYSFRGESVRLDHVFGPRFSVFGRYINNDMPNVEPGGLWGGTPIPGLGTNHANTPGRGLTVQVTMTLAPTLLNQVGYAYSYGAIITRLAGLASTSASPDIRPVLPFGSLLPRVPDLNFFAGEGIHAFGPYLDYNRNHAVFDTVTKVFRRHTLEAGFSYSHYEKDETSGNTYNGAYSFYGVNPNGQYTFEQEWASFLLGNVAKFSQSSLAQPADIIYNLPEWFVQDEYRVRPTFTMTFGFRWSFFRAPTDGRGHLSTFDPRTFDPSVAPEIDITTGLLVPGTTMPVTNGIIVNGHNSPFENAIHKQNNFNIAPRLGFVWDPFRRGTTSIRAGYGIFFDNPQKSMYEQAVFNNPPLVRNLSISNTNFGNPASVAPDFNLVPGVIYGIAPNWSQPYSQEWSLDVQQHVGRSTVIGVGYYGDRGVHLPGFIDINQPRPGAYLAAGVLPQGPIYNYNTQLLNYVRPYRGYESIDMIYTAYNSNYNSLQAQLQARFRQNSQIVANYTWSHAMTDSGGIEFGYIPPQNRYDPRAEYSNAAFDRRHIFNLNYVYALPFYSAEHSWAGHVLGGWEISGIFFAQSGEPLTVAGTNIDPAGLGVFAPNFILARPNQLGDPNRHAPHTIDKWFDTSMFASPAADGIRPGSARPNSVQGPGSVRLDAALLKNTRITESVSLQFRVEATNALNHTNLNGVSSWYPDQANFGRVNSARGPRIVQLGLKLAF